MPSAAVRARVTARFWPAATRESKATPRSTRWFASATSSMNRRFSSSSRVKLFTVTMPLMTSLKRE